MSYEPTLDHLVFGAPVLAAAVDAVHALTGVRPVEGGRHVGLGTRNHLLGLGGSAYLEVIGPDPDQPEPPQPRPFGIDALTSPRLLTWAVHPPDLDAAVARARRRGQDPGPVRAMSRRTPSGELLEWRLTVPADGDGPGPGEGSGADGGAVRLLPFLIDWGSTRHPTASGLPAVPLLALTARHADPAVLRAGLDALGVELSVRAGPGAELAAVLAGPSGPVVLR